MVVIMTDDQGYGDLGVTGNPVIDTPNMDRLARESASMSNFYVAPVCSPTRAGLMTGRYHYRTRVVDTFKGRSMMEPEETTLAEVLSKEGYRTGIFGKWHLGDCYPMRSIDQGFQESLVHRGGGLAQPSEPIENNRRYTNPILFRNGEKVETKGYCTDVYFEAAMDYMEDAHEEGKPFFVYIPPNAPHGPFHDVPEVLYEKYKGMDLTPVLKREEGNADTVARVFAMIENIDWNVGRLLKKLKQLEVDENTLVMLLFDNGPNTRRFVGPFRGKKGEVYEGGIRSPLYVRWPSELEAGWVSQRPAAYIDLMPTLLAAAGADPTGLNMDGRNLLPLLKGDDEFEWSERALVIQVHRGDQPVRYHHFAIRKGPWKLLRASGFHRETPPEEVAFELYNLEKDPGEENDLGKDHPERVQHLKKAYEDWFADVSRTRTDNFAPPWIVVGTDQETRTVLTWQDWRVVDGGGWGQQGRWLVEFRARQVYDILLRWPDPIPPAEIELLIGSVKRTITTRSAAKELEIQGITLPAGKREVRGKVRFQDEERQGRPYHVILERRPR